MTVMLREAVGERLRRARAAQSRTLRDVSHAARVSLGYLSEVERGRKEASSELLASICDALDLPLPELLVTVAGDLDKGVVAPEVVGQGATGGDQLVPSLLGAQLPEGELAGAAARSGAAGSDWADELVDAEPRATADGSAGDLYLQSMLSHRIDAPVRKDVVVAA
ncbi:helix-turn-helix transcriptional regulator [Salinifilum aidingensis]